jgi:hypothetical protein
VRSEKGEWLDQYASVGHSEGWISYLKGEIEKERAGRAKAQERSAQGRKLRGCQ